jgi:hypothetical protein
MRLAIVVQDSANAKIGKVSTTYAPTVHCVDCPMRGAGCYAQHGMVGMHVRRLDAAAREGHASPVRSARQEAAGIDALKARGQALRIHTSGDCPTPESARIVAAAARRFIKRGGGPAWTYTHAWRRVARSDWRGVSVLASCESAADVRLARRRGYAPAVVVPAFSGDKAWHDPATGTRMIPCPAQTRGVTCEDCRLCWRADHLFAIGAGVAFAAHGSARKKAAAACEGARDA